MRTDKYTDTILDGLLERRTVLLTGDIDEGVIHEVRRRLLVLQMRSNDPITFLIDSIGGCPAASLHLCDLMTTLMSAPIRGIAIGDCKSAATFIMLHCAQRIGTPHSRYLIHSGSKKVTISINHSTTEQVEQLLRDSKRTEETVQRLYMNKLTPKAWEDTAPTPEERRAFVEQLLRRGDQRFDYTMSATEALEVGLIQEIVEHKLDIFHS